MSFERQPRGPMSYAEVPAAHHALHDPENKVAATFAQMFYHQSLMEENPVIRQPGRTTAEQITIKSSSITREGLLIAPIKLEAFQQPIRTLNDLGLADTQHLMQTVEDCMEIGSQISHPEVIVTHINFSHEPQWSTPEQVVAGKRLTAPIRASQTIGTLHAHVDFFDPDDLGRLVHNPKELAQVAGFPKSIELRRQFAPHPLTYVARGFWQHEAVPHLLKEFPDIFETVTPAPHPDRPADPDMTIQLKPGLPALSTPDYAQAVKYIQSQADSVWDKFSHLIWQMKEHPDQAKDLLSQAVSAHPFLTQTVASDSPDFYNSKATYADIIQSVSRLAKPRSTNPHDNPQDYEKNPKNFMQSNGTIGVIKWQDRKPLLFMDFRPSSNSGIESANLIRVRNQVPPDDLTHREQLLFRRDLIHMIRTRRPNQYTLGPEGEGTMELITGITSAYEQARQARRDDEQLKANKAGDHPWPAGLPTHIEKLIDHQPSLN